MPSPRRPKLPRELFETRSHAWHSLGLGDELAPRMSKRALGGLLVALLVLAATLVVYYNRHRLLPGYGQWVRIATVAILIVVGSAATYWLVRGLSPPRADKVDVRARFGSDAGPAAGQGAAAAGDHGADALPVFGS